MALRLFVVGALAFVVSAIPRPAAAQAADQTIYRPGPGVTNPTLVSQVQPLYTAEALRAKIQGVVHVEVVVLPDGAVGAVRVVRSLDQVFGLDEEAITAARKWRFTPALVAGKPVPIVVLLVLEFRVHQGEEEFSRGTHREDAPGVTRPKLMRQVEAKYTAEALRRKIQGTVVVEAVVNPDGTVARTRIAESLDKTFGLDEAALAAVGAWLFEPASGTLNGEPVPVLMRLNVQFRIH